MKAQFDLDTQTAKICALSSENVGKYKFSTGEDVLSDKGLLEKATTIKRFEYSPLGSELKKQTVMKKEKEETLKKDNKTATLQKYDKSNLIFSSRYSFCKYHDIKKWNKLSFKSKYLYLYGFLHKTSLVD